MKTRAYAAFEIKAAEEQSGKRIFTGVASAIATDRMDDVVVPTGAKFKLPLPLIWQHNSREPIGWVRAARVSDTEIEVDCEVAKLDRPGSLKDRIDDAWDMLVMKLVRGLSIGFNGLETSRIDGSYGTKYLSWEWLELSPVTIAAHQDASITAIKSADQAIRRAALGARPVVRLDPAPAVSGTPNPGASGAAPTRRKGVVYLT